MGVSRYVDLMFCPACSTQNRVTLERTLDDEVGADWVGACSSCGSELTLLFIKDLVESFQEVKKDEAN